MDATGPCDLRDDLGLKETESITAVLVDMGDSAEAKDTVCCMLTNTVNIGLEDCRMIEGCSIHARLLGGRWAKPETARDMLGSPKVSWNHKPQQTFLLLPSASTIKHAYGSLQVQGYFVLIQHEHPVLPASARMNLRLLFGNRHWKQGHVRGFT